MKGPPTPEKARKIFRDLADALWKIQDAGETHCQPRQTESPVIRGGIVQLPCVAEATGVAITALAPVVESAVPWNSFTADDVVWEFASQILASAAADRKNKLHSATAMATRRLFDHISPWVLDSLVFGLDESCSGVQFGRIEFQIKNVDELTDSCAWGPDFPKGKQMFARLETTAVDEDSAMNRAGHIVDEHLMVLNAISASETPSRFQVTRGQHPFRHHRVQTVGRSPQTMEQSLVGGTNTRLHLQRTAIDELLVKPLGSGVSQMLKASETEFNQRVLKGYQLAGAACVDLHPERSFLMLAIGLESAILGRDTTSELTYQLGTRVAHLIGKDLQGRKLVSKTVNELYGRRSKIVHTGEYGVPRREAALMFFYTMNALAVLVVSPAFRGFTTNAELDDWFRNRMLDGPSHFNPQPGSTVE